MKNILWGNVFVWMCTFFSTGMIMRTIKTGNCEVKMHKNNATRFQLDSFKHLLIQVTSNSFGKNSGIY